MAVLYWKQASPKRDSPNTPGMQPLVVVVGPVSVSVVVVGVPVSVEVGMPVSSGIVVASELVVGVVLVLVLGVVEPIIVSIPVVAVSTAVDSPSKHDRLAHSITVGTARFIATPVRASTIAIALVHGHRDEHPRRFLQTTTAVCLIEADEHDSVATRQRYDCLAPLLERERCIDVPQTIRNVLDDCFG